jgi:phosphatidylglycerol:prolipoprotein diacylglycerol transferase
VWPILFEIGGRPVHAYGLALSVAFLAGTALGGFRARREGVAGRHILVVASWAFVAALAGSRFFYLLFEDPSGLARPGEWVRLWAGGLVFYGGFFGAVASSFLYARAAGISFLLLGDLLAPSIALGHGIVRIGCFLNGCCYGKPASWGVVFPALGDGVARQPAQLYESAVGIALCAVLLAVEKRWGGPGNDAIAGKESPRTESARGRPGLRPGSLLCLYLVAYGVARFLLEMVRDDDRGPRPAGLTVSQWLGLGCAAAGAAIWLSQRPRA